MVYYNIRIISFNKKSKSHATIKILFSMHRDWQLCNGSCFDQGFYGNHPTVDSYLFSGHPLYWA